MNLLGKLLTPVLAAALIFSSGCSEAKQENSQTESQTTESETTMELTQKTYAADEQYVKLIGRTGSDEGIRWLALSASGVEVTFKGTQASFTLVGDNQVQQGKDKQARYAVYINGEKTIDAQLDELEKTVEVFASDEAVETTVKLLKLSEAQESTMGIKAINLTAESDPVPTAAKALKIEFIGDSITCGYGVDDEDRDHHFSTSTEDATRAYAYKTAVALDADYSLVSYSGNGIISGYSDGKKKVTTQLVPKVYEKFAKSWGSADMFNVSSLDWDFSKFVPDFIVINLGTNDDSYTGNDKERIEDYTVNYVEFLKMIRKNNPDAHIICTLGVMGDRLFKAVEDAAGRYTEETGDTNISTYHFTPQDGSTGFAADWHPTEATHQIAADGLVEEIKSLMN